MQFRRDDIQALLNEIKKIQAGKYKIDFVRFIIDKSLIFLGAIFVIKEFTPGGVRSFEIDTTKSRVTYSMSGAPLAWCECPPELREQLKLYAKNQFINKLKSNNKILF